MIPSAAAGVGGRSRAGGLVVVGALVAAVLGPAPARGQDAGSGLGGGARFQVFDFSSPVAASLSHVSLLTVPVGGRVAVSDQLSVEAGGYFARGEVTRLNGRTSELSGLTDVDVRASLELADDRVTLTAVGRLPTGKDGYTLEELDVLGVVASDLFPFRISNWGTGGGFGLQASTGAEVGALNTAVGVGFFRSGEFDPLEEQLVSYRPGDNLRVRAAVSAPVGGAGQLALQGGFQWFGDDELRDANVFEPGVRWSARSRYSFAVGRRGAGFVYGAFHRRERGVPIELFRPSASKDLVLAGGGLRLRLGAVELRPTVDARLLRRGDDTSEGESLRVGGEAEWRLGGVTLIPTLRGHLGELTVRDGTESGFVGLDVGLTIRSADGVL